ncbi:hypothetical protein BDC45DRAFT_540334 [Circinella umbellata]|nr:hypothetical protein BDC45DRAFT_540334 [Circinella umbellata]
MNVELAALESQIAEELRVVFDIEYSIIYKYPVRNYFGYTVDDLGEHSNIHLLPAPQKRLSDTDNGINKNTNILGGKRAHTLNQTFADKIQLSTYILRCFKGVAMINETVAELVDIVRFKGYSSFRYCRRWVNNTALWMYPTRVETFYGIVIIHSKLTG